MKTFTKMLALCLSLVLYLSLAACSGSTDSKDSTKDSAPKATEAVTAEATEAPAEAPTEAPTYGSYQVGGGTLTLMQFTTDAESVLGDDRYYPNSEGWLVLVFTADGEITNTAVDSFLQSIAIDDCTYQANQIGIPDNVDWRYDTEFAIDNEKDVIAIYDAPEDYEASLDKIHINAEKAE